MRGALVREIAVIGGGASGLAAAIAAAQEGCRVTVYEAQDRVGKKILATGNGRCNLTNMQLGSADYHNGAFTAQALEQLGPQAVRDWFFELGLFTVEEREGRVYPLSNAANSVLDVLRLACDRAGVRIQTQAKVKGICAQQGGFGLNVKDAGTVHADKVVVACGGGSRLLASCGHRLADSEPILCPIETDTKDLRGLNGVRVRANVKLTAPGSKEVVFEEAGELLFRDYGVSGIVALNASRYIQEGQKLRIDFIPSMTEEHLHQVLKQRAAKAVNYGELMCGIFHPQVNRMLIRANNCRPDDAFDERGITRMACMPKNFKLDVMGPANPKQAQVTRGGACVDQFDSETMESTSVPGLYACGECLDVDGPCGGYNLHWAWASGITAGRAASL